MVSCPYCGNTFSITSCTDGNYYCPTCHYYFKMITSTIADVATISAPSNGVNIPDSAVYKLTINVKDITINDDKISITIDKDNIYNFDIIEIDGVKFVREDNQYVFQSF